MNFLEVVRPADEALAERIEAMRAAGNTHLPNATLAIGSGIHRPMWVSPDRTQIVFAHVRGGVVERIAVFEVGPDESITFTTRGCSFRLAAGEGWMLDPRRTDQRVQYVHHAMRVHAEL